jgi:hypothetical protein
MKLIDWSENLLTFALSNLWLTSRGESYYSQEGSDQKSQCLFQNTTYL